MATAKITFASVMKTTPTLTVLSLPLPYLTLPVLTTVQITVNVSKGTVYVIPLIWVCPATFSPYVLTTVQITENVTIINVNVIQGTPELIAVSKYVLINALIMENVKIGNVNVPSGMKVLIAQ